jgi:hypothetical protein
MNSGLCIRNQYNILNDHCHCVVCLVWNGVKAKLITSVEVKNGRYQNDNRFKSVSSSNVEILNNYLVF